MKGSSVQEILMQALITADTTDVSYWLNWRVLLCAIWVLFSLVIALYILWKYESFGYLKAAVAVTEQDVDRLLHNEDVWRPCLKEIHPIWLLAFRAFAFCLLLATLIVRVLISGGRIYYYYTQWTFTLVTIYFGFGLLLSIYGCYHYQKTSRGFTVCEDGTDAEEGHYVPLIEESTSIRQTKKTSSLQDASEAAGLSSYLFQVLFQISAGAVVLTDCIYWFVIFPFLTVKDYDLNFMTVNMHTSNIILLLGETSLNCLGFPMFRIAYFFLWTGCFVVFQWILHACVLVWWPYPFLDLSSPYAPLWYMLVALMHIPCYGIFAVIVKIKHDFLSNWFPQSSFHLR